jgi:hypothetical protein
MLMVFEKAGLKIRTESQRYGLKNKTVLRVIYIRCLPLRSKCEFKKLRGRGLWLSPRWIKIY